MTSRASYKEKEALQQALREVKEGKTQQLRELVRELGLEEIS